MTGQTELRNMQDMGDLRMIKNEKYINVPDILKRRADRLRSSSKQSIWSERK